MNLARSSVSSNEVQGETTQEHEERERRCAPFLTAPSAGQKYQYVYADVRGTPDDDRARVVLCLTATYFTGWGE